MAKTKTPRLNPGDVVGGRYRIDGVVGRGGFGAVYRATQQDTGVEVALKVLIKNFSSSKVDAKRFQREAALVQKLHHPNVVQLLDFGTTDEGTSYIAFELLHGTALSKLLKQGGALPLYRAAQITRDILSALAAAHALGVIHRDIKPGNIFLLEGTDEAKVLDFGIAKAVTGEEAGATQLTEAGQMIGTPHYMAPEQVRGTGVVPGTDVYSTGLLFAEMICGERMVKGSALIDIYMMHISNDPIPLPEVVSQSPVAEVVRRAMAKVVEQRYATAGEMLADLDRVMPGLAGGAARPIRGADPAVTAPLRRDERLGEVSSAAISALSSLSSSTFPAAGEGQPSSGNDEDVVETRLMDRPGAQAGGVGALEGGDAASTGRPREPSGGMDATLDMDGSFSPLVDSVQANDPRAAPVGSTQTMGHGASSPSGLQVDHGYPSRLGDQGFSTSGGQGHPSRPPAAGPRRGGGTTMAVVVIVLAVVATAAAGLLLWAPWQDARCAPKSGALEQRA